MIGSVTREATATARSQPVASVVTILTVAAMIVAVMLTTGRTVGAEQQILGSIDAAGTRSIMIRAQPGAGVTSEVLDRIAGIDGIEWAGAFSSATDATNSLIPDGVRVPVRYAYGAHFDRMGVPTQVALPGELAWASDRALEQLGLLDHTGGITLVEGGTYGVAGLIEVPDYLVEFEPLVLIPRPNAAGAAPVSVIVVIATGPELVAAVSDAVMSVLAAEDSTKVTLETSEALAQLRALVQGQLGSFSRGLVLALLALTGALVAALLYGLVMMRRKDFGRRRALGATRSLVIALLLTQTALLASVGIGLGTTAAITALVSTHDPLPGAAFTAALAVLTLATTLIAALIPALVASRREPIRELRVP